MLQCMNAERIKEDQFVKYYVYILQCSDKTLYTGSTNNLKKRLTAHNTSKYGAHYTKIRRPVILVYCENCKTRRNALQREHALKKLTRKEKLDVIARPRDHGQLVLPGASRRRGVSSQRSRQY